MRWCLVLVVAAIKKESTLSGMHNSGPLYTISEVVFYNFKKPLEISAGNSNSKLQSHWLCATWHAETQTISTKKQEQVFVIKSKSDKSDGILGLSTFFDVLNCFATAHETAIFSFFLRLSSNAGSPGARGAASRRFASRRALENASRRPWILEAKRLERIFIGVFNEKG